MVLRQRTPHSLKKILLLLGIGFGAGCARPGYVGPFKPVGVELTRDAASKILAPFGDAAVGSYRALYRVRLISRGKSSSLRYGLAFKEPNKFRLDVLPLNGAYALASLIDTGSQVIYREQGRPREIFSDSRAAILKYFALPLSSSEAAAVLSRRIPGPASGYRCYAGPDTVCVDADSAKLAFFDSRGGLASLQIRSKDLEQVRLQASFSGGGLEILLPRESLKAELVEIQRKADPNIPSELFGF